jgi:hypothetical protein
VLALDRGLGARETKQALEGSPVRMRFARSGGQKASRWPYRDRVGAAGGKAAGADSLVPAVHTSRL